MKIQDRGAWLVVLGACLGTTLIRLRLLGVPLERDEGEYAYIAQMLLQGEAPYGAVHDLKSPGIFVAYALIFLVAEQSHLAIHLALLWVNVATTLLVFLLGRKLLDATAGAAAAVSYAALSLSGGVLGFTANAEPLVLLPVCGGLVLLLRARESEQLAWLAASGLALATAQAATICWARMSSGASGGLSRSSLLARTARSRPAHSTSSSRVSGYSRPFGRPPWK